MFKILKRWYHYIFPQRKPKNWMSDVDKILHPNKVSPEERQTQREKKLTIDTRDIVEKQYEAREKGYSIQGWEGRPSGKM